MEQQALSNRSPDRLDGSLPIRRLPLAPAEAELITVSGQVMLRDVVESPMHAPLEQGKERFGGIDMDLTSDILPFGVRDGLVPASERVADPMIRRRVISHNLGALVNPLSDSSLECLSIEPIHNAGMDAATYLALDQGHHGSFPLRGASTFPQPRLAADIGFIHLDNAMQQGLHRLLTHGIPDAMGKMPSRLVGLEAEVSLKLEGRDTLLMGAHRMEGLDPLPECDVRPLHDRADGDGELPPTAVALQQAVPDLRGPRRNPSRVLALAVRADRAFRPANVLKDRPSFILSQAGHIDGCHVFQVSKCRGNVAHE